MNRNSFYVDSKGGGHWDFRFWLFFRSVFRFLCQKTSVFWFSCSLRFSDFSFFSIWFPVLVINTGGFSVLIADGVFSFSYFFLFGFWFLFDLSGNWSWICICSRKTSVLFRGMCDKLNVAVRDHASGMTPETLPSRSFGQLQMCLPCQQKLVKVEAIVNCVTFLYKEGKGGKNLERKHV